MPARPVARRQEVEDDRPARCPVWPAVHPTLRCRTHSSGATRTQCLSESVFVPTRQTVPALHASEHRVADRRAQEYNMPAGGGLELGRAAERVDSRIPRILTVDDIGMATNGVICSERITPILRRA